MDDEDFLNFPQVSRSGRILKKSTKWLEAEKSLEEAWLPSHKKSWYFNGSVHHSYKKKNKNRKRFNSKSRNGSTPSTSASSVYSTSASSVHSTSASSVFSTSASSVHSTSASSSDEYEAPSPESTSENDNQSCSSSPDLILESACEKFKNVLALQDKKATDHKYCSQLMRIDRKPGQSGVPEINPGESSAACVGGTRDLNKNMLQDRTYQSKLAATYQHLPLREISEMVGEAWKSDPRKDNYFWIWTPDQLSLRNQIPNISPDAAPETVVVFCPVREVPERRDDRPKRKNCINNASLGIAPIDVAAHLKLLGDGLTEIAQKILNSECEPSSSGVYSVMLDSLLCSTGALLCLTREIPGLQDLPVDSFKKTLDHMAYFLPGV